MKYHLILMIINRKKRLIGSMLEVIWNAYLLNYHYNHRDFHNTKIDKNQSFDFFRFYRIRI